VSFLDFAPTVLSLAGIQPPDWLHGHAFLGKHATPSQPFLFGFRGRMDERYDLVRSATDGRYVYIRNYMPHLIYGQLDYYMFLMPTAQVWKKLHDQGKLTPAQDRFWQAKPPEELYDLQSDPDEVNNLATHAEHREVLKKLRQAQQNYARRMRDLGFLPEGELFSRAPGTAPFDMGQDDRKYPFDRIFATAELASMLQPEAIPELKKALADNDSAVRYWAALGIFVRGAKGVEAAGTELRGALKNDRSPWVRIVAAQALGKFGTDDDLKRALPLLLERSNWDANDFFTVLAALNALDAIGSKAAPIAEGLKGLPTKGKLPDERYHSLIPWLIKDVQAKFK
jgi:uncharacterized sulfatase